MKYENLVKFKKQYDNASPDQMLKLEEDTLRQIEKIREDGITRKNQAEVEYLCDLCDYIRSPTTSPADPGQPSTGGWNNRDAPSLFRPQIGYKSYRSLFAQGGSLSTGGFEFFREFIGAVLSGGGDRRLKWAGDDSPDEVRTARAMAESPPSSGGYLVPEQFASEILDVALEDVIVANRARVYPMQSNVLNLPGWDIGSHASNLYGGVTCSWKSEGTSMTAANPKARMITLTAYKLTAYVESSNELKIDAPNFESEIMGMIGKAIGWYLDRSMIDAGSTGDGAGKCQSYLNSPALIAVSKETGQAASTIVYQNLTNMLARLFPPSFQRSIWIANNDVIPQLMGISISVGTGGSAYPVLSEKSGTFSIFGRPVVFTEKCPSLGSQGDISLVDLSQYVIGMRGTLQLAASPHVLFQSDQTAWRAIVRVNGQGTWNEAVTPAESSDTLSPFVTLEARS